MHGNACFSVFSHPMSRAQGLAAAWVALAVSLTLLLHYHDRFWWPPDEGNFAHVAERILQGEILHADVQDVHAGHINFLNAGAMAVFGRRLISMRYPLVAAALIQAVIIFLLVLPRDPWLAAAASISSTGLGVIQYLNPTPHWYCLLFTVAVVYWLNRRPVGARARLEVTGFLLVTIFLFRQLTGVLVAMGVLTFLVLESTETAERTTPPRRIRSLLARVLVGLMIAGLAAYLGRTTGPSGWILFGLGPLGLLFLAWREVGISDRRCLALVGRLLAGGGLAVLPLGLYHAAHGSLEAWFSDTVIAATQLPQLPFLQHVSFVSWGALGVVTFASGHWPGMLSGAFWVIAPLIPLVLGVAVFRHLTRQHHRISAFAVLPIVAVFYAVVSAHYAIPIYLFYSLGLSVVALLSLSAESGGRTKRAVGVVGALMLTALAVYFQAAQPVTRSGRDIVEGRRDPVVASTGLSRSGLRVDPPSHALYDAAVELIARETRPDEAIAAIPSNAELYFLAARRNPFRFYNSALGVRDARELDGVLEILEHDPPRLVFFRPEDKYNTPQSAVIMAFVRARYAPPAQLGPFEIYRRVDRKASEE